jgi:hypothetical protein
VVYAPGGRCIGYKCTSIKDAVTHRKNMAQVYNYAGSWRDRYDHKQLTNINIDFLEKIKQIKQDFKQDLRIRIEEPYINLYTDSIDTLKEIVGRFNAAESKYIESINYPASKEIADLLNAGSILTKTSNDYSHKVFLRDGRYAPETKLQILNYLDGLGDIVKLSPGSRDMLSKPYPSIWGVFFYTNDPNIIAFLALISPAIILNIHELVLAE